MHADTCHEHRLAVHTLLMFFPSAQRQRTKSRVYTNHGILVYATVIQPWLKSVHLPIGMADAPSVLPSLAQCCLSNVKHLATGSLGLQHTPDVRKVCLDSKSCTELCRCRSALYAHLLVLITGHVLNPLMKLCTNRKALPVLTPATALALPPVLLAFATALADAELELPRQLFTVGSVAIAAENASAVPELCASEAASAHTQVCITLHNTWGTI